MTLIEKDLKELNDGPVDDIILYGKRFAIKLPDNITELESISLVKDIPSMSEVKVDIKGYRQLSEAEQTLINEVKEIANDIERILGHVAETCPDHDARWLAIGTTDLQKGFMSVVRAIARPESF